MAEQLATVGMSLIVLAWIVQAYSCFASRKACTFHIGFIGLYCLGAIILGLDAYLTNTPFFAAANLLAALFAAVAFYLARSI